MHKCVRELKRKDWLKTCLVN